jgi:cytochrome c oxidase assembly protein subunit 15
MTAAPTPWLHRFAVLTALATLVLVGIGGLVTSHGVGMAVPDWPNTYGYNMFFFPISQWVGGIFYEHSHRLFASGVGLLTTILALWLHGKGARPLLGWGGLVLAILGVVTVLLVPRHRADGIVVGITGWAALLASFVWPRCEPSPKWLRRLGLLAFFGVVLQGILGGLRVVLFTDQIGIFHATLAQLFFVLVCSLALFTSPRWQKRNPKSEIRGPNHAYRLRPPFLGTTLLILGQLVLGATMRHQHAGLAIPDFPLAYGKIWPAMDPASVAKYNQQRIEVVATNPITSVQIALQMVHRLVAVLILFAVGLCAWSARKRFGGSDSVSRLTLLWLSLVLIQALLGAATIWSNKAADIATLHVLTGALMLAFGAILTIVAYDQRRATATKTQSTGEATSGLNTLQARASSAAHVH